MTASSYVLQMQGLNERTNSNGHPGYHNFICGNGSSATSGNAYGDVIDNQDNSRYPSQRHLHSCDDQRTGADILLDLLHCAPQHHDHRAVNNDCSAYERQDYHLVSAPSSSFPVGYQHAYNPYNFPGFAAPAAASALHVAESADGKHAHFPKSMRLFDLQRMFGQASYYNSSAAFAAASANGPAAQTSANYPMTMASQNSAPDGGYCATAADLRIHGNERLQRSDSSGTDGDVPNASLDAGKTDVGLEIKMPKLEPASCESSLSFADGDGQQRSCGSETTGLSLPRARLCRRANNGGRGSRGSGAHGCPYCPKKFYDTQEAAAHQQSCVQQRPFDCRHCGRRFRQKTSLVQHLRIHTDTRPYQCRFCVRNFKQKSHLDQHERIHTGAKPYVCKFCSKAFRQKSGQASHELTHTNAFMHSFQTKCEENDDQHGASSDADEGEEDEDDVTRQLHFHERLDRHYAAISVAGVFDGSFRSVPQE